MIGISVTDNYQFRIAIRGRVTANKNHSFSNNWFSWSKLLLGFQIGFTFPHSLPLCLPIIISHGCWSPSIINICWPHPNTVRG